MPALHEDIGVGRENEDAETRSKAVDAVDKIYGVDDGHDEYHRERIAHPDGYLVQTEDAVHIGDEKSAERKEQRRHSLNHELVARLHAETVVENADKIDEKRTGCHDKRGDAHHNTRLSHILKGVERCAQSDDGRGHKHNAAKTGHGSLVHLAAVG